MRLISLNKRKLNNILYFDKIAENSNPVLIFKISYCTLEFFTHLLSVILFDYDVALMMFIQYTVKLKYRQKYKFTN